MNNIAKEIRISRSKGIYKNRETAFLKLKNIEHKTGQPIMVKYYLDSNNDQIDIILAIGIKDGIGEDCFSVISQSGLILIKDIVIGSENIPDVSNLVHGELYLYKNDENVWNYVYLYENNRIISPIQGGPYIYSSLKDNFRWFYNEGSLKREDDFFTKEEINALEESLRNELDNINQSTEDEFSKLKEMVLELDKEVFPISLSFNSLSGNLFLTGESIDIIFKILTTRKNLDITKDCTYTLNEEIITLNENNEYLKNNVSSTTNFILKALYNDLGIETSKSLIINFGYNFYYGKVTEDWEINENNIKLLENKKLQIKQNITYLSNLTQEKIVFACPKVYGKLSHIYDSNNFDYIDDYTIEELDVNGIEYFIYIKKNPTTITNFKQLFTY